MDCFHQKNTSIEGLYTELLYTIFGYSAIPTACYIIIVACCLLRCWLLCSYKYVLSALHLCCLASVIICTYTLNGRCSAITSAIDTSLLCKKYCYDRDYKRSVL